MAIKFIFPVHLETKIWHFYFGGIGKIFCKSAWYGALVKAKIRHDLYQNFTPLKSSNQSDFFKPLRKYVLYSKINKSTIQHANFKNAGV